MNRNKIENNVYESIITDHCSTIKQKIPCDDKIYCHWKGRKRSNKKRKRTKLSVNKKSGECQRNFTIKGIIQGKQIVQRNQDLQKIRISNVIKNPYLGKYLK